VNDPLPDVPPVTTDGAGTIRVGGRYPATPSLARERASRLMGLVELACCDEVTSHPYGTMSRAQAEALAEALWQAARAEVRRLARLTPEPVDTKRGA
jgi:hypothetical protein